MATKLTICSSALVQLGSDPLQSLDGSDRSILVSETYDFVRDFILRKHPWNCATKRVILSPNVTPPVFDYAHAFDLPGDWLRTLQVGQLGWNMEYVTEGRQILTNDSPLPLKYIFRNEVESSWDTMLVQTMLIAMKASCAYSITQSTSKEQLLIEQMRDALKDAQAVDGIENPPEDFGDFPLLNARFRN